jgi:MarR family transcriptional regulator, organic hydroperoxide resistance regulator
VIRTQPTNPAAELMNAIERIRRLSNQLSRLLQDELGVSVYQVGILAAIDDGARHLHEVAEATGQQVSSASRLVDRLVNDGALERSADPDDRRAVVLGLTPAGEGLLADARQLIGRMINRSVERMPPDEAQRLLPVMISFLDAADGVLGDRTE